ncbi:MAG: toxin-antitoxin system, antitoxin component, Xre family protein [Moorea sp. SIOASIH]|uniref:toxin-antitoxin system, antitoxin component, Xre family protein n=1 Tax=Moorena sp. SIOASIH TaxID=2607817 RepID=UPI0013B8B4A4|nr:toxin-antitoxin system, antitoxin component, Xre family protein [Moorena sp. SIOASIH]NEO36621.1 toxin-antitoxin system, antitoxin component, Xre family protein [Moorena sp. SIOASIH]
MRANSTLENRLIEKLKKLSLEQIQQVENLIDALSQDNTERELTVLSTKLSESVFAKIWDNPEDAEYDNL